MNGRNFWLPCYQATDAAAIIWHVGSNTREASTSGRDSTVREVSSQHVHLCVPGYSQIGRIEHLSPSL